MKHLYLRIPDELHARVKKEAALKGVSMNRLVVSAIEIWLRSITITGFFKSESDDEAGQILINIPPYELKKLERMMGEENPLWEPEWFAKKDADG